MQPASLCPRALARRFGWILPLALGLWSLAAQAQRVVVLELEGDRGGRVRGQVEAALRAAAEVELVPLDRYREAAERQQLRGLRAMAPSGVARLAPALKLDAAVAGTVGAAFLARILDPGGEELWSRSIPLGRDGLGAENARKLAAAISAAASPRPLESSEPPPPPAPKPEPPPPPLPEVAPAPPIASAPPPPPAPGPSLLTLRLGVASNWRGYCSRPAVTACGDYVALPDKPPGETVNLSSRLPYEGLAVSADVFPLASAEGWWRGLGVSAGYVFSLPAIKFQVSTPSSNTPEKSATGVDQVFQTWVVYRHYAALGPWHAPAYVGARGGLLLHDYVLDPKAEAPLPGTARLHGVVGVEVGLSAFRFARLEVAALFFPGARPGPRERDAYGNPATSLGFGAEAELSGEVWGPWGYSLKGTVHAYTDAFLGAGTRWTGGGAAEESFATAVLSAIARF